MASRMSMANLTGKEDSFKDNQPKVTDFDKFLPWACNQFSIDDDVIITRAIQEPHVSFVSAAKKATSRRTISRLMTRKLKDSVDEDDSFRDLKSAIELEKTLRIETLYDCYENLVQIKFLQNKAITRKIIQVIGFIVPYHKHLTSITINSGLRMDTLYEIAKFLPESYITELCLDGTFFSEANYHILLTYGKLKHLSLARCLINDAVVKTITDQLGAASPASRVLSALNLSSNRITDVGAKYVAGMLRTNRQLSYLNIAGNMITDEGGMSILDTLQKFPLEAQELYDSRARYVAFLKKKNELVNTLIIELQAAKEDIITKKKSLKCQQNVVQKPVTETESDARSMQEKAEYLAESKMGLFQDHFSPDNTESRDGVVRCFGNNTLCCLNLAHNNLTYVSVKKLHDVLLTQRSLHRTPRGLIKVVIQGNLMPVACKEYDEINRLLEARLVDIRKRTVTVTKRKH